MKEIRPKRKALCRSRNIVACCLLFCLSNALMNTAAAEEYRLSLPRIEATHYDELYDDDGEPCRGSYGYGNSQWLESLAEEALDEEEADTLEMAEEKLGFPIARPAYLPEGATITYVWIYGYPEVNIYDSIEFRYSLRSDLGTRTFTFYQDYVGKEAYLDLETTDPMERVAYEGRTYLCVSYKYQTQDYNDINYTLHWLEGDFAYCVEIDAFSMSAFDTAEEQERFESYPYLDELLRIASSLTLTVDDAIH